MKRKLHRAQRKRPLSSLDTSDEENHNYRQRSRTPPSETFSYEDEHHHKCSHRSPTRKGLVNDAMSKALDRISKSPFTCKIEWAELPRRFHQPTFTMYNGRTVPVKHVSQFNRRMVVHSKDEALMYKAFGSRFITSSKVPWLLDSLLPLSMREGETLKAYSDRYWEMYNEIEGNYDDVAISTFKSGLPTEHGLRKSLTGKPITSLRQLMDRIDKHKWVEEDQQLGKGKVKFVPQERRDFKSDRFNNNN
ncbi:uncharacterized protein LOC126721447 [Quercus robur]|uniref:uncharacterized protein LOC126721447 n=1 Tax=Quercus robur TaxID=38942 RepID=UPI002163CE4B|nr:uncharacterized protein LOC126721447 [Quercus robur]